MHPSKKAYCVSKENAKECPAAAKLGKSAHAEKMHGSVPVPFELAKPGGLLLLT